MTYTTRPSQTLAINLPQPAQAEAAGRVPSAKAMLGVSFAGACAFLNLYATQPLLPFFEQYFHCTKAEASLTVSAAAMAVALSAPVIGVLADRLGRKRIIVPSIFLLALPTILTAVSSNLIELTFWRFVQGLILPAVFAISMAYVTEEWDDKSVGGAMGVFVSANVLGGFAGRYMSGLIAEYFNWRWAFALLAVATIIGGLLTWWLLPPSQTKMRRRASGSLFQSVACHLQNPGLLVTFAVGSIVLFSSIAAFTYINYRLAASPYYFSSGALSTLFAVYLVGAVVTPIAGKLIDRLGFRKAYSIAIILSLSGLLVTLSAQLPLIILGLAIFCSGIFVCQSATSSSLRTMAGTGRSAAAGLYVFFYYLGGGLGGYLPGLVFDSCGWNSCVAIVVSMQVIALALAWFFWKSNLLESGRKRTVFLKGANLPACSYARSLCLVREMVVQK
jgi:MFS transporter, YNFM family, putative membrane transport protein